MTAAARYLLDARARERAKPEEGIFAPLLSGLLEMPHVSVIGPQGLHDRTPTVAFTVDGHRPRDVASALAAKEIAIWSGHHYALEPMKAYGVWERGGLARAGVVRYTTAEDVSRLLDAVRTWGA